MALEAKQLTFPFKGLNQTDSFSNPTDATTQNALNVLPYNSTDNKFRGGQRPGLTKYFSSQVNSNNSIQNISSVVEAFDPSSLIASTSLFSQKFSSLTSTGRLATIDSTNWEDCDGTTSNNYCGNSPASTNEQLQVLDLDSIRSVSNDGPTGTSKQGALIKNITVGQTYIVKAKMRAKPAATASSELGGILFRAEPTANNHMYAALVRGSGANEFKIELRYPEAGVGNNLLATSTVFTMSVDSGGTYTSEREMELSVSGDVVSVKFDGLERISATNVTSAESSNTRVGIGVNRLTVGVNNLAITEVNVFTGIQPASLRKTTVVAIAGGTIKFGTKTDGLSIPTNGTNAVASTGIVRAQGAFQKVFFVNGSTSDYKYLRLSDDSVRDWATDITAGSLPKGSVDTTKSARIIALYYGAIVLSGLQEDPQNWFMSAINDPFDWDTSVTVETGAIAGNNSVAGLIGDVVTALVPYKDDRLFFGGGTSLHVMPGHPRQGGRIDNISRQIGIVSPDAFTWDDNVLFFVGPNGFYRLPVGGQLENLANNRLDKVFVDLDPSANNIRLAYDYDLKGVFIFITPVATPTSPTDQYYWDQRTDSFWRFQFPISMGPSAVHVYNSDIRSDRAVLLGGTQGYIRKIDRTATNDDGTAISSSVDLTMFRPQSVREQVKLNELAITLDSSSGANVDFKIFGGNTPQQTIESTTALYTRVLASANKNIFQPMLTRDSFKLQLSNTTLDQTWALENGEIIFERVGVSRR